MHSLTKVLAAAAATAAILPATAGAAGPPAGAPIPALPIPTQIPTGSNPALDYLPGFLPTGGENPGAANIPAQLPDQAAKGRENADRPVGPNASAKAKSRAYGTYCKAESKKRVEGQSGTPFSKCVTAMAKLASGKASNPRSACKDLSKKRVAGQKGSPFSLCVSGAAKLLRDQAETDEPAEESTTSEPTVTPEG